MKVTLWEPSLNGGARLVRSAFSRLLRCKTCFAGVLFA